MRLFLTAGSDGSAFHTSRPASTEAGGSVPITVILNWQGLLKR